MRVHGNTAGLRRKSGGSITGMSITQTVIDIPAEYEKKIFGEYDAYAKILERTYHVTLISRDGSVKIIGEPGPAGSAAAVLEKLLALVRGGGEITEQSVNYAVSLNMEDKADALLEIDRDLICHTVSGKPIKPKTLGQKAYVDQIRQKMIVFGIGPAGTGKTFLAMAMGITAFKNDEVSRIILTRPAIEVGEKLGFLPGDLQSKIDPYLRPLYDALYAVLRAGRGGTYHQSRQNLHCRISAKP